MLTKVELDNPAQNEYNRAAAGGRTPARMLTARPLAVDTKPVPIVVRQLLKGCLLYGLALPTIRIAPPSLAQCEGTLLYSALSRLVYTAAKFAGLR